MQSTDQLLADRHWLLQKLADVLTHKDVSKQPPSVIAAAINHAAKQSTRLDKEIANSGIWS